MTKLDRVNSVDSADIVIVGNGIAGLTAAVDARRLAPDKRIIMITEQSHPTINTPALKQFAIGKLNREQLLAYPAGTERAQLIHVINARVEEINAQGKYVQLRGGRGFGYGDLLIATGSAPSGLPANLPGRNFDGVLSLHRLNDYLDLRRRLSEVEEVVVIGGGAHAIETVMGMLYLGIRVHWLMTRYGAAGSCWKRPKDVAMSNTLKDLSVHLGVSPSTVSRALSGHDLKRSSTRVRWCTPKPRRWELWGGLAGWPGWSRINSSYCPAS